MEEFYREGECIDGEKVHIKSKKIVRQSPTVSPTGFTGIKYKCSRVGSAEIIKALSEKDSKLAMMRNEDIHLNVGDRLRCDSFYFIAKSMKDVTGLFNVTMMSGRHECNEGTPKVRVYAEIQTPFAHLSNDIDTSQKNNLKVCSKLNNLENKYE